MRKSIKIMGHEYSVEPTPNLQRDEANGGGDCWHLRARIRIDDSLPITKQEEIFLHEIIEAVKSNLNLEKLDHDTLTILSEALYCVFQDNKIDFVDPLQVRKKVK